MSRALKYSIAAAFVIVALLLGWTAYKGDWKNASTLGPKVNSMTTIKSTFYGFRTEEQLGRLIEIAKSNDKEASRDFIGKALFSRECIPLAPGDEVFIERKTGNNFMQIRKKGQSETWYTLESAFNL